MGPVPRAIAKSGGHDNKLAVRIAALQERVKSKQAEYRTDKSRLAEDMAKRDADNHTDAIRRFIALVGMIANGVTIPLFPICRPA